MSPILIVPALSLLENDLGDGIFVSEADLPSATVLGFYDPSVQMFYIQAADPSIQTGEFSYTIMDSSEREASTTVTVNFLTNSLSTRCVVTGPTGTLPEPPLPLTSQPVTDTFIYTLIDASGQTVTANVTVSIVPCIVPKPVFEADPVTTITLTSQASVHTPVHGWGVFRAVAKGTGSTQTADAAFNATNVGNAADPFDWSLWRRKPYAMDSEKLKSSLIYGENTEIVQDIAAQSRPIVRRSPDTPRAQAMAKKRPITIAAEPLRLDGINVYDPFTGLVPGVAGRELSFISDYDPASYGGDTVWGRPQVGKLWWDTSSSPYIEAQTDVLDDADQARTAREIAYRRANWGRFAPGSSVSVWEWTRSTESPQDGLFITQGLPNNPFIQVAEYDEASQQTLRVYYYWNRNSTARPINIPGRSLTAQQVASILASPTEEGLPWIAPIIPNGFLVSNVGPYLNNTDTVLQIEVANSDYEGVVHYEWQLARNGDDRLPPPADLVRQMGHSLVGCDDFRQPVPDPSLPVQQRMGAGFRPRKSLLATDRDDILAARRSFVTIVNLIFARTNLLIEHPEVVAELTSATPTYPYLVWSRPLGTDAIEMPPAATYDFVATSVQERDAILRSKKYRELAGYRTYALPFAPEYCQHYRAPRVLLTNFESQNPSWSIWEIPASAYDNDQTEGDPLALMAIAKAFDLTFATYADLLAAAAGSQVAPGQRCLVTNDERYDGIWTISYYAPSSVEADANGLIFEMAQTYRTTDFFSVVDWYASGYNALNAPIISYPTITQRNLIEGPNPRNVFVRVDDDSTGSWIWTVYDGQNWNTVAREAATIELSTKLYDPARPVYAIDDFDPSLVTIRDGSLDLRQIEIALRTKVLTKAQSIEVFFSLLHFVHTRQDQVNWAFKSSFMSVVGFNERVSQTPVAAYDTTENLLEYLDEVKPYHTKTRDFTRVLTPAIDQANVHVTDFDKPSYYDAVLGRYRRLDPANAGDLAIAQTTAPYKDWYAAFAGIQANPTGSSYDPVRRMKVTVRFDRFDVDANTISGVATEQTALARLLAWYAPTEGMVAKNQTETLIGIGFKGTIVDGGALSGGQDDIDAVVDGNGTGDAIDVSLNPDVSGQPSYGLHAPYVEAGHAQEMLIATMNEGISLTARTGWTVGAPPQQTSEVETRGNRKATISIPFPLLASSDDAVMVYHDGLRALQGVDYTVDHAARAVRYTMPAKNRPKTLEAQVFGVSGTGVLAVQGIFRGDGSTQIFTLTAAPTGPIEVVIDGLVLQASQYTVTGAQIILGNPPAKGALVLVNGHAQGSRPTRVHVEHLTYNSDQTWTLASPAPFGPVDALSTIVEVDGQRLNPPFARYGTLARGNRILTLCPVTHAKNVDIYLDGVISTATIAHHPRYTEASATEVSTILAQTSADFALIGDTIYAVNPKIQNERVLVVVRERHGFEISQTAAGRVLKIVKPLGSSDWGSSGFDQFSTNEEAPVPADLRIDVTSFENDDLMGIEAHSFDGSTGGVYLVPTSTANAHDTFVWVDGRKLHQGRDYTISVLPIDYDYGDYDDITAGFNGQPLITVTIPGAQRNYNRIVVTAYTGAPAQAASRWRLNSAVPGPVLTGAQVMTAAIDGTIVPAVGQSPSGLRNLYTLAGSYEAFDLPVSDTMVLANDVLPGDTEIAITVRDTVFDGKLFTASPLAVPDLEAAQPGVIQIGDERIEYFAMDRQDNTVTLSQLRRGSRLTPPGLRPRKVVWLRGDGVTTALPFPGADPLKPIEVAVRSANGTVTPLTLTNDFTIAAVATGSSIALNVAPISGAYAYAVQDQEPLHPQGTPVENITPQKGDVDYGPFRRSYAPVIVKDPPNNS